MIRYCFRPTAESWKRSVEGRQKIRHTRDRRLMMAFPLLELEGSWEEIAARSSEFAGRKVRLVVFSEERDPAHGQPLAFRPAEGPSTARSLLKYAGTWDGDDLEERLREVYENRGKARF